MEAVPGVCGVGPLPCIHGGGIPPTGARWSFPSNSEVQLGVKINDEVHLKEKWSHEGLDRWYPSTLPRHATSKEDGEEEELGWQERVPYTRGRHMRQRGPNHRASITGATSATTIFRRPSSAWSTVKCPSRTQSRGHDDTLVRRLGGSHIIIYSLSPRRSSSTYCFHHGPAFSASAREQCLLLLPPASTRATPPVPREQRWSTCLVGR
jgi:hypothetical protein